jgi:hypothetical protein
MKNLKKHPSVKLKKQLHTEVTLNFKKLYYCNNLQFNNEDSSTV